MKTKQTVFRGVATAIATPFRGGEIDFAAFDRMINNQIAAGIPAIVVGGTTGEAATLSRSERRRLFFHAKESINGRTKLILGTGTNDTREAVERTKLSGEVGADAVLVVTPYYNKGTEEGVFRHYSLIASESASPVILYNVPSRTGVNLGLNLLSRLAQNDKICGLKEASDSTDRLVNLAKFRNTLPLYAGNDSQIYPTLALGGAGVISVVSNIFPHITADICKSYFEGNSKKSLELQLAIMPLVSALFAETNPAPLKYALSELGICSGELRLPLYEVREDTKAKIKELLPSLCALEAESQ